MTYVAKTYGFFQKIRQIINGKYFKVAFLSIASFMLFVGTMNVYAEDTYTIEPAWDGVKTFSNTASGLDSDSLDEDNMTTHLGQETTNTLWNVIMYSAPGVTVGAEALANNPDIPADLKVGLLGLTDAAIATVYSNTPSVDVLAHLQEEWVPGYEESTSGIYAEDTTNVSGYQSLMDSGIAPLWSKLRDIAYIAFVVVMIVIGFMIMFRSKIGGQTLVSLGNTIPNVIVSLILVTFSFAIAGLVIDIGGFLITLMYSLFEGNVTSIGDIAALMSSLFSGLGASVGTVISDHFTNLANSVTQAPLLGLLKIIATLQTDLVIGVVGLLVFVIAIGIVFVGAIKLIIVLYKAYFQLLLNVILGPLQIMIGTLPGKSASRTNWFLSILRNVLVFPIVYFIVNIPIYLTSLTGEMSLSFPDKLTGTSLVDSTADAATLSLNSGLIGLVFMFVFRIFVLYYACQAPKFAEAIIPQVMDNKAGAEAMANAKASLGGIPLVGGLFK